MLRYPGLWRCRPVVWLESSTLKQEAVSFSETVVPPYETTLTQTTVHIFTFLKSNALSIRRFKCPGLLRRIDGTTTPRHVGIYQPTRCQISEDFFQQHQSRNVRDSITNLRGRAQHSLKKYVALVVTLGTTQFTRCSIDVAISAHRTRSIHRFRCFT